MKDKIHKIAHDWLGVIFMLCFWFECGRLSQQYLGGYQAGAFIGFWLLGVYCTYKKED
jgi:hypothetical protein